MHLRASALPVRRSAVALRTVQSEAQFLMTFTEPSEHGMQQLSLRIFVCILHVTGEPNPCRDKSALGDATPRHQVLRGQCAQGAAARGGRGGGSECGMVLQ